MIENLKTTGPYLEPLEDRIDRFLSAIAAGDAAEALGVCPFSYALEVHGPEGSAERFRAEIIRVEGHKPEAVAYGATELEAVRLAVLHLPALAVRLAKIEAKISERAVAMRDASALTIADVDYLAGVALKDIRERRRGLEKARPFPNQPPEEFAAVRQRMADRVDRITETIDKLTALRFALKHGRRSSDRTEPANLDAINANARRGLIE